jgi:hypothetical protein
MDGRSWHLARSGVAEVLERYSRETQVSWRIRRLHAAIASAGPRPPAEPPWVARKVSRRLGEAELARLVQEYEAGDGCTVLSRRYSLSENGVLAQLKRAGVTIRPRGKVSAADVSEMARLRSAGWTYRAVGEKFGVTRTAVTVRLNATPRPESCTTD